MADFSPRSTLADVEALDGVVHPGKAMTRIGEVLPSGFLGPVRGWGGLVPTAERALILPREIATLDAERRFDCICVEAWTESLGRIETTLPRLVGRLDDGGTLLLDIDNVQSARMLRQVLEGRSGPFDPADCLADPTTFLSLRRVLAALGASGLWIHDVIRVPAPAVEVPDGFAGMLLQNGLLALEWFQGAPPDRFWFVCRKVPACLGSVLVAGGDPAARERTADGIRDYLPKNWEIVQGDGIRECAQWNRAIAAARGEVVWFVRGGTTPSEATFAALSRVAAMGPVVPAHDGVRAQAGDVAGLMVPRTDILLAGALPEACANTRVALEEYSLRLDAVLPKMELVEADFDCAPPPCEAPELLANESAELFERWRDLQPKAAAGPAPDAVAPAMPLATSASPVVSSTIHSSATSVQDSPWAGRSPRITLCMITRDEERFLGDCLSRARDAVDEVIIVDTGSTDRTCEIAASFGAKIVKTTWQDDFSAPRNLGLQQATGDWILVLDADEFLQPGSVERIRELVCEPHVLGYHLRFVNVYGEGRTLGVMMVRLFRNLPGVAYQNVIHEQVTPSLQRLGAPLGLVLTCADVEVEHHGYTDQVMASRGKNERNERLFRKQLAQSPDDIYALYKFGDFLRRVPGRSVDAKLHLDRCLDLILNGHPSLPRELPYAGEVAALCALEAARVGDHQRAREVLATALRRFVPTPNLHYLAASVALADGRAEDAILHYRRCLAYRGQVLVVPIQEGITGHVSLAGIAQAWVMRGQIDRALPLLEQAIALEPSYEVAYLAMSKLHLLRDDVPQALRVLTTFLASHPDSPGACQQITLILQRLGEFDAAKRMGQRAVQLLEARALDHEAAALQEVLAAM